MSVSMSLSYQTQGGESDVKHASYAQERDPERSTLLIKSELCAVQCSNQMSVKEDRVRTFHSFTFYR